MKNSAQKTAALAAIAGGTGIAFLGYGAAVLATSHRQVISDFPVGGSTPEEEAYKPQSKLEKTGRELKPK